MAKQTEHGANSMPNGQSAVDLSHHINAASKSRHPSPLKDIIKFMGYDGMISLAGGLPHPSLFPLSDASFSVADPTSEDGTGKLSISINSASSPPLPSFLQYGSGAGNAQLREWCRDFTQRVHQPVRDDFEILLHPGNTNAWAKVVGLLCERGEHILMESFTYPSAQALWIPLGNLACPIETDEQGMRADRLRETLVNWDANHPGTRRPHVLYLVSVGSNPSGVTMGVERRKDIYDLCVEYDIIIVEDDPYYFLQYPAYSLNESNHTALARQTGPEFVSSLVPSFLRLDHQGRVIRLESFSKTLFPGLRLGYFVANPLFTERLLRATEVETQDPAGLSQALALSILEKWTADGYLDWLQHLRIEYHARCNWLIDAFSKHFDLVPASECPELVGAQGIVGTMKSEATGKSVPIFSFVAPVGGMFIWAKFYLAANPTFQEIQAAGASADPEQESAEKLWAQLAEALVLLTPGSYYHPWQGHDKVTTSARGAEPGTTHFRFSFAMVSKAEMEEGIARFAKVIRKSWAL